MNIEIEKLKVYLVSLTSCLIFFFIFTFNVTAETKANITMFGAQPDDLKEDTQAIQDTIDSQSRKGGGTVYFPKGEYLVNAIESVKLKDNITLDFEKGAILKALPNNAESYQMIRIHDVSNIKIVGDGKFIGERERHIGNSGESGHVVSIKGAKNVSLENMRISNAWGDGIYIGNSSKRNFSENIKIINPVIDNSRRQGISIISAKNLEILDPLISNTNGTSPQSGIDIEPNNPSQFLENINILNLSTTNNRGPGLKLFLNKYAYSENPISININSIENISEGYRISGLENVKGDIDIAGYQYLSGSDFSLAPSVEKIYDTTTKVTGTAPAGTLIAIILGESFLGKVETTKEGKFEVLIPNQESGTELRIRLRDRFGNTIGNAYVTVQKSQYLDLNNTHWAFEEIMYLAKYRIIEGYPNGSFQPNKNTTRAEAAKILATALKLPIKETSSKYKDVSSQYWAKNYIASVSEAGLFNGYPNGTFAPNDLITRAEMAKVISMAYDFKASKANYFYDVKYNHWAKGYISALFENNITKGYPNGTFQPDESTKRAEFAVFVARAMDVDFR